MRAALFLVFLSYVVSAVLAAKNVTVYSKDAAQVDYFGSGWKSYTDCGGTMYSYAIGDYFSLSFTGTDVYVVGTVGSSGGIVTVSLDGSQTQADRYRNTSYLCGEVIFSKTGLPNTKHDITVNFTSQSTGLDSGYIDWQWVQFTVPDEPLSPSLPPTPSSTPSPNSSQVPNEAPAKKKDSNGMLPLIIGIVGAILLLIGVGGLIFYLVRRKKGKKLAKQAAQMANSLPVLHEPMSFAPSMTPATATNSNPFAPPPPPAPAQAFHAGYPADHKAPLPTGNPTTPNTPYSSTPYGSHSFPGSESATSLMTNQQPSPGYPPSPQNPFLSPYGPDSKSANPFGASSSSVNLHYQQHLRPTDQYPMSPLSSTSSPSSYGPPPGLPAIPTHSHPAPHPSAPPSVVASSHSGSGATARSEKSRHFVANPEPPAPAPAYDANGRLGDEDVDRIAARVIASMRVNNAGTSAGASGSNVPDLENDPAFLAANIRDAMSGRTDAPPNYDRKR